MVWKFATVGDPHTANTADETRWKDNPLLSGQNERLRKIVKYLNYRKDISFVVFIGDNVSYLCTTDQVAQNNSFLAFKNIVSGLNIPYYVVLGNHDAEGGNNCVIYSDHMNFTRKSCKFTDYFGVNGDQLYKITKDGIEYQLIFYGCYDTEECANLCTPPCNVRWYFNFNNPEIDKTKNTFVFGHLPVYQRIDPERTCVGNSVDNSLLTELNKFINLLGVYYGHVHLDQSAFKNGTLYVMNEALIARGPSNCPQVAATQIGITTVDRDNITYDLVNFEKKKTDLFLLIILILVFVIFVIYLIDI